MVMISEVPGISGSLLDLLLAAGFLTAESLILRPASEVLEALAAVNQEHEIPVRLPSEGMVLTWQNSARSLLRRAGRADVLPAATEIRGADLEAAGIDVSAMPVARVVEDAPQRMDQATRKTDPARAPGPDPQVKKAARAPSVPVREEFKEKGTAVEGKRHRRETDSSAATRKGNEGTSAEAAPALRNRQEVAGKAKAEARPRELELAAANRFRPLEAVRNAKRPSERRNRGMSHPVAVRVRFAAAVTVLGLTSVALTTGALGAALVMALFHDWEFHWTLALLLLIYPVSLFLYLGIGAKARCRLCGQRLFVPKHCRKHERASRSIFGHTFAVARNAMFLANYRCMLCGTKTRLKD
jgi:hypothetical protein